VLYIAANHVFRTRDDGASWVTISPDLTRNDQEKITKQRPGSHAVGENEGNHYCTISSFAESARTPGVLWAGSDDGLVHVSRDDGANWTNVTPPEIPAWATVHVEPSPHHDQVAFVSATAHGLDDFQPYVFQTRDSGWTWRRITEGIKHDEFVRVIREDPAQRGLLYAGTEAGVYVSVTDGALWYPLQLNLPIVAIHDLTVNFGDLIAGTHGRGMWILDDVTPLRELTGDVLDRGMHLCRPRPVYRVTRHVYGLDSLIALYHRFAADNPPSGAVIYYRLDQPAERVTVSLIDADGTVVNSYDSRAEPRRPSPIGPMAYALRYGSATLTGAVVGEDEPGIRWGAQTLDRGADPRRLPIGAGLHRVALDITYPGARRVPGAQGRGITAPIAPPGIYGVRLTVDGVTREQPIEIRADPRLTTTPAQYAAQFAFMLRLRDKVSEIHDAVNTLRDLRGQIEARLRPLDAQPAWDAVRAAAETVLGQLTKIEESLIQPGLHERSGELDSVHFPIRLNNKLEALGFHVARSDDAPTAQAEELFVDLAGRADAQLARFRRVVTDDVGVFNAAMAAAAAPAVIVAGAWE